VSFNGNIANTFNNTTGISMEPPFTVISIGGPGSPDAHLQVEGVTSTTIGVATPIWRSYPSGTTVSLLAPTGKVYPAYLPADKFKVAYVYTLSVPAISPYSALPYEPLPLPVLLDIWGNPILYFPAYNSYTNQAVIGQKCAPIAAGPALQNLQAAVTIGPLLGTPSSQQVPSTGNLAYQYNTPMTSTILPKPYQAVDSYTGPSIFWSGPLTTCGTATGQVSQWTTGQVAALLFKLGDKNGDNAIDNTSGYQIIGGSGNDLSTVETLAVQTKYFMCSAGPDGQFTDLYPGLASPPIVGVTIQQDILAWQQVIDRSENVYSFDP
jgi:hypothetical protein